MRLVAYVRVSAVAGRDVETATSAPDQRRAIEGVVAARGFEISEWVEDFDESGGKWERPGFQRVLEMVERREVDGIIVARLDRFSRSLVDALRAIELIDAAGGQLVSVADNFDTTTPMGRAMLQISLVFAELERERIRETWNVNKSRAIARGVHITKTPPFGYRRRDDGGLEPDPATALIARNLFSRRAAGESWANLARLLDEAAPRTGEGRWTRATVASMLRRRTYLGEARHGDLVNQTAHEAIVGRAEFEAVQVSPNGPPTRSGSLLAGLVRCAGCSAVMTGSKGKGGYRSYACRKRHGGGVCPEPSRISCRRLDGYVERIFLDLASRKLLAVEASSRSDALNLAAAAVESAEVELVEYRDANLVSVIGRDAYVGGLQERARELDDARRELAQTQAQTFATLGRFDLVTTWPTLTTAERRTILTGEIDAVFVRRAHSRGQGTPVEDRARICWRGQAPADLPGRRGGALRPFVFDDRPGGLGVPGAHNSEEA